MMDSKIWMRAVVGLLFICVSLAGNAAALEGKSIWVDNRRVDIGDPCARSGSIVTLRDKLTEIEDPPGDGALYKSNFNEGFNFGLFIDRGAKEVDTVTMFEYEIVYGVALTYEECKDPSDIICETLPDRMVCKYDGLPDV